MEKDGSSASSAERPVPAARFEPPRLKPLGSLAALTKAFVPGSNTDFTLTSF